MESSPNSGCGIPDLWNANPKSGFAFHDMLFAREAAVFVFCTPFLMNNDENGVFCSPVTARSVTGPTARPHCPSFSAGSASEAVKPIRGLSASDGRWISAPSTAVAPLLDASDRETLRQKSNEPLAARRRLERGGKERSECGFRVERTSPPLSYLMPSHFIPPDIRMTEAGRLVASVGKGASSGKMTRDRSAMIWTWSTSFPPFM